MNEFPRGRPQGGRFGLGPLLLAITLSVLWFLALRPAVDPDYGWHVENGRRVLDGTAFSGRDLYSWTATGDWVVHQWLTEAGMSTVHDSLGASANSILAALLWTTAFYLVAIRLRSRGFGWPSTILTVVLGFFCTMMSAGVRPQVLELVYLASLLLLVDRYLTGSVGRRGFVALTVLLAVLWVNTHGSFPLLMAVTGLTAAGLLVAGNGHWRVMAAVTAACMLAALLNPWGWTIYQFATQSTMSQPTLSMIEEWKRPQLLTGSLIPFVVAALLAAAAATVRLLRRGEAPVGTRLRLDDVFIFLAMLYLGLSSGRHVMLFGIGAAPLIAWTLGAAGRWRLSVMTGRTVPVLPDRDAAARDRVNVGAALIVAAAILVLGWSVVNPRAQTSAVAVRYPVGLVNHLRSRVSSGSRMFNEYSWGGFLIEKGVTPVFIDGRSELYGDDQLLRYARIARLAEGWARVLDSLGVDIAVMPRDSRLAVGLARRGWIVAAEDSVGVVLERPE